MATRMEVVQLESRMEAKDYRKLQSLFTVGSRSAKVTQQRRQPDAGGGVA